MPFSAKEDSRFGQACVWPREPAGGCYVHSAYQLLVPKGEECHWESVRACDL